MCGASSYVLQALALGSCFFVLTDFTYATLLVSLALCRVGSFRITLSSWLILFVGSYSTGILEVDSPFFAAIVLFKNRSPLPKSFWWFSRKIRIPEKNGNGSYP